MIVTVKEPVTNVIVNEEKTTVTVQEACTRVYVSGPIGVATNVTPEHYRGSDCTGASGDLERVLTLRNTSTTKAVFVSVGGATLHEPDFDIVRKASHSEITFHVPIDDSSYIQVLNFT